MAEVTTSDSTLSAYLPPRKKAKMQQATEDPFKSVGSLRFLIDNFREFSNNTILLHVETDTSMRHCDAKVSVRGLTFGLAVSSLRWTSREDPAKEYKCMGIVLSCENTSGCDVKGDGSWSCLASVKFRVKGSLKSRPAGDIFNSAHRFFSSKDESSLELELPLPFDALLDPKRGIYNVKNDTLELIAEISVDSPVGVMELPKTNTILVNEETVEVNKHQLAMHSPYFHSLFYNAQFDEGKSGEYKVEIEEPATVEHFKRMLDTMCPMNKPLDDQCIEGVLHLANQFLMADVEGKCLEFLTEKSTKSALFKYRMADNYGCTGLKAYVLDNLKVSDFRGKMFKSNMAEYNQLGTSAAEDFMARYDEIYPPESDEEDE